MEQSPINNKVAVAWLQFAAMDWLGPTLKNGIIKKFRCPLKALSATTNDLVQIKGMSYKKAERFVKDAPLTKPACSLKVLEEKNIQMLTYHQPSYPEWLKEIPDAPIVIFVKGSVEMVSKTPAIAIVGARDASQRGYNLARSFGYELAKAGFTIVSGMALGIDAHAHAGALNASNNTIAVLANGPDVVYPKSNLKLYNSIVKNSAVISEYPPGTTPRPWHFPVRNRIISGLAVATIVIEASARSGSLITARLAAEQNREYFAIPGTKGSKFSEGTLSLIEEGAALVTDPNEIIEYYSDILPARQTHADSISADEQLSIEETRLVNELSDAPMSIDDLIEEKKWKRESLFSLLLNLEMRNYLVKLPGNCYQSKIKLFKGRP